MEGKEGEKVKEEKTTPGLIESIKDIASEEDKSTLQVRTLDQQGSLPSHGDLRSQ